MADTNEIAQYGLILGLAYIGYKSMSGIGSAATAPARFVGDTLNGVFGAGGSLFGGVMDTADNLGDWGGGIAGGAGEVVNETLAIPGDLIKTGQGAVDSTVGGLTDFGGDIAGGATSTVDNAVSGVTSTVDNLNPF